MLNNILVILLSGFVISCSVHQKYPLPNGSYDNRAAVPSPPPAYSTDRNSGYYEPYPNRPSKRLAPVAQPTRSTNREPIYSEQPYPSNNQPSRSRPLKRIAPPARFRNNESTYPSKRISPPKYLKQPSSNYAPSQVPSSRGYLTRGYASQYKLAEHGMRTTSGQVYDMYGMTAAHINLPLMSSVVVKNLRTGRSIIVVINDRLRHGLIKLSYAAANKLKLLKKSSQLLEVKGF
ncbi:MAG: hypothetical protein IMF12_06920 [Proteobacteria bacterium]|nr:hypothetical protein [Pseudomonadota bacterium]